MQQPKSAALECRGLSKSFSGVRVLRDIGFTVAAGTVLGIAGENGAGKSTLMNIVGGIFQPDAGSMYVSGQPYAPPTPVEASARGIAFVHQELNLFPNLSIADNLFLTSNPAWIDRRAAHAKAGLLLREVGLKCAPSTKVEYLSLAERQLVEIARAIGFHARIVILDEPTTSLGTQDAERLFGIMRELTARGIALVYISHALGDLLRLSDSILVLRDGEVVEHGAAPEFTPERLITAMVGRNIGQMFPPKPDTEPGGTVLETSRLTQPGVLHDITFSLQTGEILGIAGLVGSGRSELARVIFGLDPLQSGEIRLGGERIDGFTTRERIARGLAFVTESRADDGLFLDLTVEANLNSVAPVQEALHGLVERLGIRCQDARTQPVKQLSGGNQQKVAIGKWLVRRPVALILDEPTRGVDVGAKQEIYRALLSLAARGVAILVISSELEELAGICGRILVMRRGELQATPAGVFDREWILRAAL